MSDVAESTWAKTAARVVTPILLSVTSVMLTILIASVNGVASEQAEQGKAMNLLQVNLGTLNTKVDWALVQRITALEDRVRTLEGKHSQ